MTTEKVQEQEQSTDKPADPGKGCEFAANGCIVYCILCVVAAMLPPLWPLLVGLGLFYLFIRWREHKWLKRADLDELIEAKRADERIAELCRKEREEQEAAREKS
jgi:hypothetical protein